MIFLRTVIVLGISALVSALGPTVYPITTLVSFGDSYTDLNTLLTSQAPAWPVFASGLGHFEIIDVAVIGATCNISQVFGLGPVLAFQIPRYTIESLGGLRVNEASSVFSIWIGTNDVGGLLVGNTAPGVTISDIVYCSSVQWVKSMYDLGARNFLVQNMIPLELTPQYKNNAAMATIVHDGNNLSRQFLSTLAPTLPGAHVGYFDSYSLFSDMYYHPDQYLNGTDPLNVDGSIAQLGIPPGPRRASYLWADQLHPSEQADKIVAREIVKAVNGQGSYTTWFT